MDSGFDGGDIVGLIGHKIPKLVYIGRGGRDLYVEYIPKKPFKLGVRGADSELSTDFRSRSPDTLVRRNP